MISAAFVVALWRRTSSRGWKPHLAWWTAGVFFYGLGTLLESIITLSGNTIFFNKAWYIAGALLGGYPVAQGTVYLLLNRRTANILTSISIPFVVVAAVCVVASPVVHSAMEANRPGGAILEWQWVRLLTPFINLYAAFFLIGGAFLSALRYFRKSNNPHRVAGNILIAVGAILPGIGGGMAKAGHVDALHVGELIGIILIWAGYALCVQEPAGVAPATSMAT